MTEAEHEQQCSERYSRAGHRVQTAIAFLMGLGAGADPGTSPKHLRVGVDLRASDAKGLVDLLIEKGVFTKAEYLEAVAKAAEEEADSYEAKLAEQMGGVNVKTI